jgi:transposase-like protein
MAGAPACAARTGPPRYSDLGRHPGHHQGDRGWLSARARQRCVAHRMRNLAAKVPEDVWPDFKVRAQAAYQALSRAIARELAGGVVADYGRKYGSGRVLPWLHGGLRSLHRPPAIPGDASAAIRTTNLLERLFVEKRRRLKIFPEQPDDPCHSLESKRDSRVNDFEDEALAASRLSMMRIMARRMKAATVVT